MSSPQVSFTVSSDVVSEIRDYFRHEADKTYSDEAILSAINWWVSLRLDNMYEEIGEVIMSPHMPESQRFREILEAPEKAAVITPAVATTEEVTAEATTVFNGFRHFSPTRLGAMIEHIARSG